MYIYASSKKTCNSKSTHNQDHHQNQDSKTNQIMDQEAKHISFKEFDTHHSWVIMEDNMSDESISSSSSSRNSALSSSSSSDLMEDASSTSSSCSSSSNGPLYELSELMSHLPIKRGLSKYYQGKSQSFTSLASVKRTEDLVKKERKVMRSSCKSKSYGDINKYIHSPKAIIAKKVSRGSFLSSSLVGKRSASCFRPPTIPVQKNLC